MQLMQLLKFLVSLLLCLDLDMCWSLLYISWVDKLLIITLLHYYIINYITPLCRLLYLVLLAGGSALMAAMLTPDVQHNLQSAFKGGASLINSIFHFH